MAEQSFEGACHCGRVRFVVQGLEPKRFDGRRWEEAIEGHVPWR